MLTKVCQTSTTAPQTLCGQKSRGAAQAHLPARLQGLWALRLFAATLLALAACASNDLEIANLSVDPSNQEGGLKSYTYKEIVKDGRCIREDYPVFMNNKCWTPCNDGDFYYKSLCYKNKKNATVYNRINGRCGKGTKCVFFYRGNKCCSCNKKIHKEYISSRFKYKNIITGDNAFCYEQYYKLEDTQDSINVYPRCNVDKYRCIDGNHANCEYNDKLQKCTWKGGLITELPAGTSYLCGKKDTEGNIHCYDVKALGNTLTKPNLLKPIQVDHRGSEICPPNTPVFAGSLCRKQCYGNNDDFYDESCYQNRSSASSTDCTGKATFSFGGKSLCCPEGKLYKNGNCYINIYRINTQRDLKPFCHTFNNSNCGIIDKSNHCAWLNGKCVWNLPEYGYPSCGIERQAVICRPTETP